jgi:hypothetical protein
MFAAQQAANNDHAPSPRRPSTQSHLAQQANAREMRNPLPTLLMILRPGEIVNQAHRPRCQQPTPCAIFPRICLALAPQSPGQGQTASTQSSACAAAGQAVATLNPTALSCDRTTIACGYISDSTATGRRLLRRIVCARCAHVFGRHVGPRSVVAVCLAIADATAARPSIERGDAARPSGWLRSEVDFRKWQTSAVVLENDLALGKCLAQLFYALFGHLRLLDHKSFQSSELLQVLDALVGDFGQFQIECF